MPDVTVTIGAQDDGSFSTWRQKLEALKAEMASATQIPVPPRDVISEHIEKWRGRLREVPVDIRPIVTATEEVQEATEKAGDGFGRLESMLNRMAMRMGILFVLHEVINGLKAAFDYAAESIQTAAHWQNILAESAEAATADLTSLQNIAMQTGTSLKDTSKHVQEFYRLGESFEAAAQSAGSLQETMQKTGVDMSQIIEKAQMGRASVQDFMTAAVAYPELRSEAIEAAQRETARRGVEFEMQERHQMLEEGMHDEIHQIEVIQSVKRTALQEEREDRKRMAQEQMEDQRRAEQQSEAAAQRAHSRTLSFAEGIRGLGEYVLTGLQKPGEVLFSQLGLGRQMDTLKKEYAKGLQELMKEEGITARQAGELLGAGLISPQTIMRYAQAREEEERITKEQQRQTEETLKRRKVAEDDREQQRSDRRVEAAERADMQALESRFTRSLAAEKRQYQKELFDEETRHVQEILEAYDKRRREFQPVDIMGIASGLNPEGASSAEKELAQKTDTLATKTDVHSEKLDELRKSTDELVTAMHERAAGGGGGGGGTLDMSQLPPEVQDAIKDASAATANYNALLADTGQGFAEAQAGAAQGEAERRKAEADYQKKRQDAIDEAQREEEAARDRAQDLLDQAEDEYSKKRAGGGPRTVMAEMPLVSEAGLGGGGEGGFGSAVIKPVQIGGGPAQEDTLKHIRRAIEKNLKETLEAIRDHLKHVLTVQAQPQ